MPEAPAASTAPAWVDEARARALCGPNAPRMALLLGSEPVGSVAAGLFDQIGLQRLLDKRYKLLIVERSGSPAWALHADDATAALNALAQALRGKVRVADDDLRRPALDNAGKADVPDPEKVPRRHRQ